MIQEIPRSGSRTTYRGFSVYRIFQSKVWGQSVKNTHQRGDAKISRRRRREEGKGECFAPFYLKITVFSMKMLFFWSWHGSRLIWDHFWKNVKNSNFHQNFDTLCVTFPLRLKSSRRPIELILSQLKALI